MTEWSNTCEGMPIGSVTGTNQNSDGYSGDQLVLTRTGAATTVGTATAGEAIWSKSLKLTFASGETCVGYWPVGAAGGVTAQSGRVAWRLPATMPAASTDVVSVIQYGLSSKAMSIRFGADGKLYLKNAADGTAYTTPSAIAGGSIIQICWAVQKGTTTSNGKLKFAVYDGTGALTAGMTAPWESTAANAGTVALNAVNMGKITASTWAASPILDAFYATDTYALPAPYVPDPWPGLTVWDGATEHAVLQLTMWNGSSEVPITSWSVYTAPAVSRGSATVGSMSYTPPADAVWVSVNDGNDTTGTGTQANPYATAAKGVAMCPSGGTVVLRGGNYREGSTPNSQGLGVTVLRPMVIQPAPGEAVWFEGSDVFSSWTLHATGVWKTAWTYTFNHSGTYSFSGSGTSLVDAAYPMSRFTEQVWHNGTYLTQVATLAEVTTGTFFVDEAADYLYIGNDPTGAEVRASTRCVAMTFAGTPPGASGSTLRGIGFRRYGNQVPDPGVIKVNRGEVLVEDCWIEDNSAIGLSVFGDTFSNVTLRRVTSIRNGLMGVQAEKANNLLLEDCLITGNNHQHFLFGQSSGGVKVTRSRPVTVRNCTISDNIGPGLWFDQSCYDMRVSGCDIQNNTGAGFTIENCATGVLVDCLVTGNGTKGVHILGANSCQVWNCTLDDDYETLVVQHDSRTWANTSDNRDSRYNPDPVQEWVITSFIGKNNVLVATGLPVLRVKDDDTGDAKRDYTTFGLDLRNLYNRTSGTANVWHLTDDDGTDLYYNSLASYQSGSGLDASSVFIDGSAALDADFRLTAAAETAVAGMAVPLPAAIATIAGKDAGVQHVGAWR